MDERRIERTERQHAANRIAQSRFARALVRKLSTKAGSQDAIAGTPFWKSILRYRRTVDSLVSVPRWLSMRRAFVRKPPAKCDSSYSPKEPDPKQLVARCAGSAPSPIPPRLAGNALVTRLFRHTLSP